MKSCTTRACRKQSAVVPLNCEIMWMSGSNPLFIMYRNCNTNFYFSSTLNIEQVPTCNTWINILSSNVNLCGAVSSALSSAWKMTLQRILNVDNIAKNINFYVLLVQARIKVGIDLRHCTAIGPQSVTCVTCCPLCNAELCFFSDMLGHYMKLMF